MNEYLLTAAIACFTAVIVHGVIGHRALFRPMSTDRLFETRQFGDADMTKRILVVAFHIVTVVFATSGVALLLLALGEIASVSLPRVIGTMFAGFLVVALAVLRSRMLSAMRYRIPIAFAICMTTVAVASWIGSSR
jgi:hypothetical protein